MNWFLSVFIGLLTAVVGCVSVGFLATLNVRWYRISSFEGGSGYYVVFLALFGAIAGLIVGVVGSRIVAGWAEPNFFKAVGVAFGSMLGLVFVIGIVCWLAADTIPEVDGKSVELAIEVKAPPRFTMPVEIGEYGARAYVDVRRGKSQPQGELRLNEAKQIDGRWIITATVPLRTSVGNKHLRAYFNKENDAFFPLPSLAHPKPKDLEWSDWVEAVWNIGNGRPDAENAFHMRFKVQVIEPPPPGPTHEEIAAREAAEDQAKFDAVTPDAPLKAWMAYTKYGTPPERLAKALATIRARPTLVADLSAMILGVDPNDVIEALRFCEQLKPVPPGLVQPIREFGEHIAESLRRLNGTSTEPPFGWENDMTQWFSAWMVAVREVQGKDGVELTPELHEVLKEARKCTDSGRIQADVTRVASYYLKEWAGVEPLPGDPPPR